MTCGWLLWHSPTLFFNCFTKPYILILDGQYLSQYNNNIFISVDEMAYIHSSNTEEVTNFKRSLLPFINSCTINGMLLSSKWCRLLILILFIMLKKDPLFINNLITRMNEWCGIRFNSIMRYRSPTWNNKTMLFNKDLRQVSNSWLNCILFFHSYSHLIRFFLLEKWYIYLVSWVLVTLLFPLLSQSMTV